MYISFFKIKSNTKTSIFIEVFLQCLQIDSILFAYTINFYKIFNNAMELIALGLYEKKNTDCSGYKFSPLLKKGLDKFALLNLIYLDGEDVLPTNENTLIRTMNKPLIEFIDKLPNKYANMIKKKRIGI